MKAQEEVCNTVKIKMFFLSKFVALYSFILVFCVRSNYAVSLQPGVFDVTLTPDAPLRAEFKSLYKDTPVRIVADPVIDGTGKVKLSWELRYTQCEGLYGIELNWNPEYERELFENHNYLFGVENYINVAANKSFEIVLQPNSHPEVTFTHHSTIGWSCYVTDLEKTDFKGCTQGVTFDQIWDTNDQAPEEANDKRNEAEEDNPPIDEHSHDSARPIEDRNVIARVPESGNYLLLIKLEVIEGKVGSVPVTIHMKGEHGYLSAFQYKLLPFYRIMCGLYMLMGFTWLFLMCYQCKDLLGIHIWIGVVILLGLIEKAVFFGEFQHMNSYGKESDLGILFPEIVSCIKRTLARLLVVVASIGYGITRPRLGSYLAYIKAAGLNYLLLSSADFIMRTSENYERTMVAVLPLSLLDGMLVWWIFRSIKKTCRLLNYRKDKTKLWLFRYFACTLLLCAVLSGIFFVWSMRSHSLNTCILEWEGLWLDDGFWHILFCLILTVIMVLLRPSSPLVAEDDEKQECDDENDAPISPIEVIFNPFHSITKREHQHDGESEEPLL